LAQARATTRSSEPTNGQIFGRANVTGAALSTTAFTTTGVDQEYVCTGQPVQTIKVSTGFYRVRFGDTAVSGSIGFPSFASATALVSPRTTGAIVSGASPTSAPGALPRHHVLHGRGSKQRRHRDRRQLHDRRRLTHGAGRTSARGAQ
jgi:hypothetical protein